MPDGRAAGVPGARRPQRARVPLLLVAVPGSGVPLGGYRWYTVGTVRAVGPWTVDSPVGALVGP